MKKIELEVSLNPSLNPPVIISNRKLTANGRGICWKRKKNEVFTFERLDELNQAYFNEQSINLKRDRIRCGNRVPGGDTTEYSYVIIVKLAGIKYSSTKIGGPAGDKPVIRN